MSGRYELCSAVHLLTSIDTMDTAATYASERACIAQQQSGVTAAAAAAEAQRGSFFCCTAAEQDTFRYLLHFLLPPFHFFGEFHFWKVRKYLPLSIEGKYLLTYLYYIRQVLRCRKKYLGTQVPTYLHDLLDSRVGAYKHVPTGLSAALSALMLEFLSGTQVGRRVPLVARYRFQQVGGAQVLLRQVGTYLGTYNMDIYPGTCARYIPTTTSTQVSKYLARYCGRYLLTSR